MGLRVNKHDSSGAGRSASGEIGWWCDHQEHSTGECGSMCECAERIRSHTYGRLTYWDRDELDKYVSQLRAEVAQVHRELNAETDRAVAAEDENERLRGFLKYLKGEAQDRDDIKLMDAIDRALARS